MTRVGDVRVGWGESLVWDERRQRLYFVDCHASTLHWLDDDDATLQTYRLSSMPTGIVPTDEGLLVGALGDGLHVIDPDGATTRLVAFYPPESGGRCNDACADLAGNIITRKLNLGPTEGSAWWWSHQHGWRIIDPDIANTNGPAVGVIDGSMTSSGLDRTLLLPVTNPTDVTFGGPSLGRLYVVSIGSDANNLDGALLIIDGLDTHGRAEPRCTLDLPLV